MVMEENVPHQELHWRSMKMSGRVWSSKMLARVERKGYRGMPTTVVNLTAEGRYREKRSHFDSNDRLATASTEISAQPRYNGEPTAYQMRQALREQFEPWNR
jgi:hypothetical protein